MALGSIYVGNLPPNATKEDVRDVFIAFGDIRDIDLVCDDKGVFKGFAFIYYEDDEDAEEAIFNVNDAEYFGRVLKAQRAKKQRAPQAKPIWDAEEYNQANLDLEKPSNNEDV